MNTRTLNDNRDDFNMILILRRTQSMAHHIEKIYLAETIVKARKVKEIQSVLSNSWKDYFITWLDFDKTSH